MRQENVRVVEAAYDSLASSGLEAFSDHWADEIEWQPMRGHVTRAEALEVVGLRG